LTEGVAMNGTGTDPGLRAIILAAGLGRRLAGTYDGPKCLLEFGGRSLLQRHVDYLTKLGVLSICVCIGYQATRVSACIEELDGRADIWTINNPDYKRGSVLSLWAARECLRSGSDVLLMDADVLYGIELLQRLTATKIRNCFLMDRDFEAGDEPVKLCISGGTIVEFRKEIDPALDFDFCGESVGFFRFDHRVAARLADHTDTYRNRGLYDAPYEEAVRDMLVESADEFGFEDISGIPWIEIDFPEDIERARLQILPAIDE